MSNVSENEEVKKAKNFIEEIIDQDLQSGYKTAVQTRFPPEPNGYLHIGHAKSICLNFGMAQQYGGACNLRFDDTNPLKESVEYVESIKKDVEWLGFEPANIFFTSNYFGKLYDFAIQLINQGDAYIDQQTPEKIAEDRGVPTKPGTESPFRNRPVEENLELFQKMKAGEFEETDNHVLRAKIDMSSPNMHMRDPIMYRVRKVHHHNTGDDWCIYPMYDFAHGLSDCIENISHSLCTLEFEVHRPLYEWFNNKVLGADTVKSQQIEFARLNLGYTVMSKRKLLQLVEENYVDGWDDPRMPTISGLRRRGYTPAAIRNFCETIGVAKRNGIIDMQLLEFNVREDLNKIAQRRLAVLDPIKVVITNYDKEGEILHAVNNPEDPEGGKREITFGKEIFIERDDFMEDAPKKYFRLAPDRVVRLKYAYIIKCNEVIKDDAGNIIELRCEYYPESKSGQDTSGIKVKGTIHWVDATNNIEKDIYLYDRLLTVEDYATESEDGEFKPYINPNSLEVIKGAKLEKALGEATADQHFQFERKGYFCADSKALSEGNLVFNRTVALKDSWAKMNKKKK